MLNVHWTTVIIAVVWVVVFLAIGSHKKQGDYDFSSAFLFPALIGLGVIVTLAGLLARAWGW